MGMIRILFLADTHLGFDLPFRPRIQRRRRGHDFFNNFRKALEPARNGQVTCVVHGGDLLYRSKVPPELVAMAFEPLHEVAAKGVPVYLVPGNHERSEIPFVLLAQAPGVYIFDRPRTFLLEQQGFSLAISGFPYIRDKVREQFRRILDQTKWKETSAHPHLLCIHQCIEGATVGPSNFTFRWGPDVIRAADIPRGLLAVLAGHIHRAQVLTKDLSGKTLPAPVIYPGSIERTSFAEKGEAKGFFVLEIDSSAATPPRWAFHELYARPMVEVAIRPSESSPIELRNLLLSTLDDLPRDSVVKFRVKGVIPTSSLELLPAASLRSLAPSTMNLSVVLNQPARS